MLTTAQAASIQQAVDDFVERLAIANNTLTRNKQTVADKDDAKNIAESLIRNYAMLIKENTGISDGDKLAVGVRPINPNRDPIFCPQTQSLINVLGGHAAANAPRPSPSRIARWFLSISSVKRPQLA